MMNMPTRGQTFCTDILHSFASADKGTADKGTDILHSFARDVQGIRIVNILDFLLG